MKEKSVGKDELREHKRGESFVQGLLGWNRYENNRQMPWKGEKDPYKIWLSEIMLQQTRVEQGLKYYQNFIEAFPDIHALADALEAKVFKLWEGLGYYSRCRNLIATAKYISKDLNGEFPKTHEAILALKGVGSYTAAAICSFAYNLPYAVLDGNVFRVLSRIFDEEVPIDSTQGKKLFSEIAQNILPQKTPGEYNQAIMDFGALICKPVPVCDECFFNQQCLAFLGGKQQLLPIKEKKTKIKKRWLNYFVVQCGDEIVIQQRSEKDIWQGLHQFVLIETKKSCKRSQLEELFQAQYGMESYTITHEWKEKQALSHQSISFHFLFLKVNKKKSVSNYTWMKLSHLQELAFPKTLQQVVQTFL
ncbi:MAG: A/G-specific adenine glycosylase [Chitinophagaceae bacterium]|nr:MAG: A/G-specific adenine glycosylase [Chitinophagaceae bacterium]